MTDWRAATGEPSARLLELLSEAPHLGSFLDRLAVLAASVVGAGVSCSISVRRNGYPYTTARSDEFAARCDQAQYGCEEGPCLDALRSGQTMQVDSLETERRWPGFRARAVEHGMVGTLAIPLPVEGRVIAVLNLYSRHPDTFRDLSRPLVEGFAAQCAAALTLLIRQRDDAELRRQLLEALESRSMIDQAVGILMAQRGCNAGEALSLLRRTSQLRNRKLRDVATDGITRVTGQPPQPPAPFRITGM